MTVTLGIFDLFTYAIPGSLHLVLATYVAARLGWLGHAQVDRLPAAALLVGVLVASYLLGQCTYRLGALVDRATPRRLRRLTEFRRIFLARVPTAEERPFVAADLVLLLAAADLHNRDAAGEITRMRAIGLMLRNASVAMLLACLVAVVQIATGPHRVVAVACAPLLLLTALGAVAQSYTLRTWANLRTLELCYWIPDIDDRFSGGFATGKPVTAVTTDPAAAPPAPHRGEPPRPPRRGAPPPHPGEGG